MQSNSWIIIPVHNRKAITRACLERLRAQGVFDRARVCVVDDACTDGTREMLESEFPQVHCVDGNGHLYWGGGILEGMKVAHAAGAGVMVWLNDDCLPAEGAIDHLIARVLETKGICGGVCRDPESPDTVTYSGTRVGEDDMVKPGPGEFLHVDLINGNLVAVHREVVDRIGLPPGRELPHYGGDSVYALRAGRVGIPCEVSGDAIATNPPNLYFDRFGKNKPAWWLLKEPFRIGSILYWPTYWRFLREAFGWRAYIRWPAYFIRLVRYLTAAFGRQFSN
ncbi:glycosyltransferase family 2 protein [Haloferula sp. BvORR071]|uniref:glycosyltransferase family 2 protein n=1 Tax=Haloferula sp. BvORR071 TaxID=1396141 RepID=UPI000696BE0B|nr:glycosyltransferase family 2 protein [Haloferula sp. BvORR071]